MKLLLIEDNANDALLLRRLIDGDFDVTQARTLAETLRVLAKESFDLVLLDLGLPDCDYRQTLGVVKSHSQPQAALVVISGFDDPALMAECMRQGAHGYLRKGLDDQDRDYVLGILKTAIARKLVN